MLARVAFFAALCLLAAHTQLRAQRLTLRHYDVADGLAHSWVSAIHHDVKGYLWFGTGEGLSCFDGYRFTNYGTRDGLEHPLINDITEDRRGRLWVATNGGGVARLLDEPAARTVAQTAGRKFISFRLGDSPEANRVNGLLFDAQDRLWCATDLGVYRAAPGPDATLKFEPLTPPKKEMADMEAVADSGGRLWFAISQAVIEVAGDRLIRYDAAELGSSSLNTLAADGEGRLVVGGEHEVFEFRAPSSEHGDGRGHWQRLPLALTPEQRIRAMLFDRLGALWIGTEAGLVKYHAGRQTFYTAAQGLSDSTVVALAADRDGNLWIGTAYGGVNKLAGELIVSFALTDGQSSQTVFEVIEDRTGRIFATLGNGQIVEMRGDQATPLPGGAARFRAPTAWLLQDARGAWWAEARNCWRRVPGPELDLRRSACFSGAGLPEAVARDWLRLYQSPAGELWLSGMGGALFLRSATSETFERLPVTLPWPEPALWMVQDRSGALWLGAIEKLWRLKDGRLTQLEADAGLPEANPRAFFVDSRGWLWVGLRYRGVSWTKDPAALTPQFVNYSTAQGLASDTVWAIAEDDAGRIYLGTGKGLDQLDPATGRIRHFNSRDGLAGDVISRCLKDRRGDLWIVAPRGLSRFNPRAERAPEAPPPIYLKHVSLAGEEWPLAETGATLIPEVRLPATRNNLLIEYVALSFRGEEKLTYQYQLEGVDADWGAPTRERTVNYGRLAPGAYRFLVRAINQDGALSPKPAVLQFRILPPLWQRWWFLTLVALMLGLMGYGLHRYRVAQLVALERTRTRIAADLHDEIGSNLSQIAVWSEVARRHAAPSPQPLSAPADQHAGAASDPLAHIAGVARATSDAMSDIVWAIHPRRDHLSDLVTRMRRSASEVFDPRNIAWRFASPAEDFDLQTDTRREVFLIFKEGVNNILRHARCRNVELGLTLDNDLLQLTISDDGRGFAAPEHHGEGNGLESMRERARKLGGHLAVDSTPGRGTALKLSVPLKYSGWRSRWRQFFKR